MDIQPHLTSPYYPQGNAIIERMHRTLGNMIRAKLVGRNEKDWPLLIPGVMIAMNEAPHEQHGYTPNEIIHGHEVRIPADLIWPSEACEETLTEYVGRIKKKLAKIRRVVQPLNQKAGTGTNPFAAGDRVLIAKRKIDKDNKFEANWKGPYLVTRVPSKHQVEYSDEEGISRLTNIIYCKKENGKRKQIRSELERTLPRHQSPLQAPGGVL